MGSAETNNIAAPTHPCCRENGGETELWLPDAGLGRANPGPDGIILEPVGGPALPQVARAAAAAGIGWVLLNRDVDYLHELRKAYAVPIFGITCDHEEIGWQCRERGHRGFARSFVGREMDWGRGRAGAH